MRTEVRFLLAITLMMAVLVGTNLLFPPAVPEEGAAGVDSTAVTEAPSDAGLDLSEPSAPGALRDSGAVQGPPEVAEGLPETAPVPEEAQERVVTVEGPLYQYTFSSRGARLLSTRLNGYESFARDGSVELVQDSTGIFGHWLIAGSDTLDLRELALEVSPADGLRLEEGGSPEALTFAYQHPTRPFAFRIVYTFMPDSYLIGVEGAVEGLDRPVLQTDMGSGLAFNEVREADELRAMAYVGNHFQDGISATNLEKVDEIEVEEGPFRWVALKSRFFVTALLPADSLSTASLFGGIIARPIPESPRADVAVNHSVARDGTFEYRIFSGPLQRSELASVGEGLEEVNPYGWRFFRPIVRPFVSIILTVLVFLHENLNIGYGWVLILFGVMMRVLLWPLNQKAMRSQLKNMAVQPLLQDIQKRYKDQPERLQKEMMKLYKEHGFNPFGGCLPMLLPWPVLIALFFVFQNTIELRGQSFLWMPDLSAADPLYVLPVFLGLSMFLIQWIGMRSMTQSNPQMKMMMYIMPVMMVFIFFSLPSGLNLYYATANVAMLPQQYWIAKERQKVQPLKPAD